MITSFIIQKEGVPARFDGLAFNACSAYNVCMEPRQETNTTTLTVRNVERRLKEQLRVRAARHGQSMEAELRQILREALAGEQAREPNLAEAIRRRFAPFGGVELEPHPRVPVGEPPRFDE